MGISNNRESEFPPTEQTIGRSDLRIATCIFSLDYPLDIMLGFASLYPNDRMTLYIVLVIQRLLEKLLTYVRRTGMRVHLGCPLGFQQNLFHFLVE